MIPRSWFIWWQFAAMAGLNLLGLVRASILRKQGHRVFVVNYRQALTQHLRDAALVGFLLLLFVESAAEAFALPYRPLPTAFYQVLVNETWLQLLGAFLMAGALLVYTVAIVSFGISWRIGIDAQAAGPLVTRGIFRWTRNPIYVALDLCAVGTFFICGSLVFLVLAVGLVVLFHDQIRREEGFLAKRYGQPYLDYCARTGRYLTWPGGG